MLKALRHGGAMLSVGTVASGVLAYAFNVLAARALGADAYGPIAVLWAGLFLASVVLFRPVEQTLSRGIADRLARDEDARPVLSAVARLAVVIVVVALAAIAGAWSPLTNRLFDGNETLTAALAIGIAGYGASFVVRGVASGMRWFHGYGVLLLVDGGVRVLLALPMLFLASQAIGAGAVALAAVAGAVAPLLARAHTPRALRDRLAARPAEAAAHPFELGRALRFAGPVGITAAADQVLVSGGPLLVALSGEPNATKVAGTVFAATMLVRAPVFLFQGCAAALLPRLTTFHALGNERAFRRFIGVACVLAAVLGGLLCAATLIAGPESMRLFYGADFVVNRGDLALLALGVGCYLVAATCSQGALARDMAWPAAGIWGLAAALFVILELVAPGNAFHRVSVAFSAAALLNALLFVALIVVPRRTRQPHPTAASASPLSSIPLVQDAS